MERYYLCWRCRPWPVDLTGTRRVNQASYKQRRRNRKKEDTLPCAGPYAGFDLALWGSFLVACLAFAAAATLRSAGVLLGELFTERNGVCCCLMGVLFLIQTVGFAHWYRPSRRRSDPALEDLI